MPCYLGEKLYPVGLVLGVLAGDEPEERNLVGLFGEQIGLSVSVHLVELKYPTLYLLGLNLTLKGHFLVYAVKLVDWDLFD